MGNVGRPARLATSRFWEKVDIGSDNDCWMWLGAALNGNRYGQFRVSRTEHTLAHRFSYEQAHGPIPEGFELDHLCGLKLCVNPRHLQVVTRAENIRRWKNLKACPVGHPWSRDKAGRFCEECIAEYQRRRSARIERVGHKTYL